MTKLNLGTRDPTTRFKGKKLIIWWLVVKNAISFYSFPMMWVHYFLYFVKVELIELLMNIFIPYGWSIKLTGALSTDFTYVMCGSRSLPMRMWLILKWTHETGISHDHNMLAVKAQVNTFIIMCEQWYLKSETTTTLE